MEKWEYLTIPLERKKEDTGKLFKPSISFWDPGYFSEQLNEYGHQGWELVSCFCTEARVRGETFSETGGTDGIFAVFKRKT